MNITPWDISKRYIMQVGELLGLCKLDTADREFRSTQIETQIENWIRGI